MINVDQIIEVKTTTVNNVTRLILPADFADVQGNVNGIVNYINEH